MGVTEQLIGKYKVLLHQLPTVFDKPITLSIEGNEWRIIKAHPHHSNEFSIFRKLTLHVLNKEQVQQAPLGHTLPTRHAVSPTGTTTPFYEQYSIDIALRQNGCKWSFYLQLQLPLIQEEVALIDPIILADNGTNPLLGYETQHVRQQTAHLGVDIPLTHFARPYR